MHATVIPTLNESRRDLVDLVHRVRAHTPRVYVVDDTPSRWAPAAAELVPGAGSLGASLTAGLTRAVADGAERVAVIDAGGSHDPADLAKLFAVDADMVIGSRMVHGGDHLGSAWRVASTWLTGRAFRASTRVPIHDWTSGYRVYSARAARAVTASKPRCTRHAWQIEALLAVIDDGCSWAEVPIIYEPSDSTLNRRAATEALRLWAVTL